MEIFRISKAKFARKLLSSGKVNRWNLDGEYVIYAGSSRSLATLELLVHKNAIKPKVSYKVMVISIPDNDSLIQQILTADLASNWRSISGISKLQRIGSKWYKNQTTLLLKVPSAVIPMENNYIINTKHKDFKNVKLVRTEDYYYDTRLL